MSLFSRPTALRTAAAFVSVSSLVALTACNSSTDSSSQSQQPNGELIMRDANGNITDTGGARRFDGDQSDALRDGINSSQAKNVILLIGDGMGDSEITIARNYAEGASGYFKGIDSLPFTGQYTHYSVHKDGKPDYVTDSAASATAWTTGTKTYNGALGVNYKGEDVPTLLEIAKANGKATGDVSTAEIQDATPGSLISHVTDRSCYGPEETTKTCPENALENDGRGSITEQLLNARPDVTLGGGYETFDEKAKSGEWEGQTLLEQANARGFNVVRDADGLNDVSKADQDEPVLGLFADGNLPVRWQGPIAFKEGYLADPVTCKDNPDRDSKTPDLAAMTSKAIDLLDDSSDDGFFLQVEGASIDKQDHKANPCGQIGETVDLDEAVQVALDYAKKSQDTLVIVTADHAHTSQIIHDVDEEGIEGIAEDNDSTPEQVRDVLYPGLSLKLNTADNSVMTVGYAQSENPDIASEGHTGTQLRIAAFGPRAANVTGLTDQTDLFFTIAQALGLDTKKH